MGGRKKVDNDKGKKKKGHVSERSRNVEDHILMRELQKPEYVGTNLCCEKELKEIKYC